MDYRDKSIHKLLVSMTDSYKKASTNSSRYYQKGSTTIRFSDHYSEYEFVDFEIVKLSMGIDYKGNQGSKGKKTDSKRKDALELIENPNVSNSRKRRRLIEDGYKEDKCERCGLSEWMGMKIPLELHHRDFNHYNNELSNLMIICSNCHM